MDVVIEAMAAEDWPAVCDIFAAGIATGSATFEVAPPDWAGWDRAHLADPRLVARVHDPAVARVHDPAVARAHDPAVPRAHDPAVPGADDSAGGRARVAGWAALSRVSARDAYAGVAEVSVYVDPLCARQGIGGRLLGELIGRSERAGVWTLQAQIFPENRASLALHARHGFRTVGVRERMGQLRGVWRDVVLLERRSPLVH
ncbi:MAG TPA: GNAT family N-acetyltransferase [Egibacteraceae bacterium]|nr:GNAT family N-acetyltransferase [Egibacteraceae bacterium]